MLRSVKLLAKMPEFSQQESKTFRTAVGRPTTELQETRRSLGHQVGLNATNFPHTATISFVDKRDRVERNDGIC